ncbi:MAG: 2-amino-4-hydroxy-6-hydroxymethyldihydropteridine diphosphokinase [Gemmatimonadota bacterium]|nr:MAG: 2-amino-4-hydroxy-6-hydroxymethyldihydropteridine diphosphokinase [Gemmatimonadota bacterium]
MTTFDRVYVALGSNVGDRDANLAMARRQLASLPDTVLHSESRIEETDPLGPQPQEKYLNQMVVLKTSMTPRELLDHCLGIERAAGRERRIRWGPRTLDLDIVRFGDLVVNEPGLVIPHPELPNRDFWRREIMELDGDA